MSHNRLFRMSKSFGTAKYLRKRGSQKNPCRDGGREIKKPLSDDIDFENPYFLYRECITEDFKRDHHYEFWVSRTAKNHLRVNH